MTIVTNKWIQLDKSVGIIINSSPMYDLIVNDTPEELEAYIVKPHDALSINNTSALWARLDTNDESVSINIIIKDFEDSATINAYILPPATEGRLGGIKVGNNLEVTDDGTLSAKVDQEAISSIVNKVDEFENKLFFLLESDTITNWKPNIVWQGIAEGTEMSIDMSVKLDDYIVSDNGVIVDGFATLGGE